LIYSQLSTRDESKHTTTVCFIAHTTSLSLCKIRLNIILRYMPSSFVCWQHRRCIIPQAVNTV